MDRWKERKNEQTNERESVNELQENLAKFMSKSPNWNLVQKCIDIIGGSGLTQGPYLGEGMVTEYFKGAALVVM